MLPRRKLLLRAAMLVLALSVTFSAGLAEAAYVGDGAVQNGVTGGWDIGDMGLCATGIKSDGTIVVDSTKSSRAACIATTFPLLTSSAACIGDDDANGGSHYWTNTCVDGSGNGISLEGLDRNANICAQKGGTWKQACTSAWVFTGPAGDGAPGFCYTKVQIAGVYDATTCPTSTGYSWDTTNSTCDFSYGIAGYVDNNITGKNGVAGPVAGTFVDLSGYTSQGQCLYDGFSWSTGVTKSGTASVATTPDTTIVAVITGARAGCLECHNNTTQYNSYAERWKTDYLKTGHKNMLRKVTPGMNWAGPEGIYTSDGTNAIDFANGTVNVGGIDRKLFYIFGDWMAPLPSLVYNTNGDGTTANSYSCAACHSTGWSNAAAGVCYPDSTKTSEAACVSPNTWVPSTGVQGTDGAEPQASYPGITGVTGKWDLEGIQCSRCHGTTVPAVAGTGTHNNGDDSSEYINNLCFSCHQSPATTYVADTIGGISYPANAKILDPTMIPTGTSHGAVWGREFNGHVLGNSFLNSPHSRFTGTIIPNSVGKYDIAGGTYDSSFSGFVCRTSATPGSGSILKTKVDGSLIKNFADCNEAVNKPAGTTGYWQSEGQGKCTTCHDVHQSVVPAVGAAEPFVRECETCHEDTGNAAGYKAAGAPQVDMSVIKHPTGPGTPFDSTLYKNSCEACHMPKPTDDGFPMHVWRINTDANYSTFPTRTAFYGGSCSVDPAVNTSSASCATAGGTWTAETKDRRALTAPDGTYTQAVWVDLDDACGTCHGGGTNSTDNPAKIQGYWFSKALLSTYATGMHSSDPSPRFSWSTDDTISFKVDFNAGNTTCPQGAACSYEWDFGDGSMLGDGMTISHTYADASAVTVTLTVMADNNASASTSQSVAPVAVNQAPTAAGLAAAAADNFTVSFTDASADAAGNSPSGITSNQVNWGDGSATPCTTGSVCTHTYATAGSFRITHTVTNAAGLSTTEKLPDPGSMTVPQKFSAGGTVTQGGAPLQGATMILKFNNTAKAVKTTAADGTYSFGNMMPGTYVVQPYKAGTVFTPATQTVTVGPDAASVDFTAAP